MRNEEGKVNQRQSRFLYIGKRGLATILSGISVIQLGIAQDVLLRDTAARCLVQCAHGPAYRPSDAIGFYSDVDIDDYNADWIEQIFSDGITKGCNENNSLYCPKEPVTKSQAVKLVLRAEHGGDYMPLMATIAPYTDVPLSHTDVDWVNQAKFEGITTGCGDGTNFCPDAVLTQQGFLKMLDGVFDGCFSDCTQESPYTQVPLNQFNIGDSIGEGEAANGAIGDLNHQVVWSTGYDADDSVNSLNERFEDANTTDYYENKASRDQAFNHAVSGAVMADFTGQANGIVAAAQASTPSGEAGMISILLGNNDVCAPSLDDMTDPFVFENQYRAGLDILAGSDKTNSANIHVSSIPAIYWLWNAKQSNFWCRVVAWPFVPCENLLDSPGDDCASTASRLDPDNLYAGDGTNCIRRKTFHKKIRDTYNPILRDVLHEYKNDGKLPNAHYSDVFDVRFEGSHVNDGDCFHPSEAGHALLSEREWCRSQWGADDPLCTP